LALVQVSAQELVQALALELVQGSVLVVAPVVAKAVGRPMEAE
jgi:hypothetical protein